MKKMLKCATLLAQCATFKTKVTQQKPSVFKGLRAVCATLPLFLINYYTKRKINIYKLLNESKKWHSDTLTQKYLGRRQSRGFLSN